MNRLINRLEAEMAATSNPIDVAEFSARIAGNLARMGKFEEADMRIASLRSRFGEGQSGRAAVWIMLAEGLLHYYRNLAPAALDRITRAQRLGMAMDYGSFVGLASAWKAHIEFEISNYESMAGSLQTALERSPETDADAQTRIGMVLANAFMQCGERSSAQRWFLHGHANASRNGDQASIEALLYNRAAFGFSWLRAESCIRALMADELRALRSEVQSTKSLQKLTRISALDHHIFLVEAGLLLLEREYALARQAFSAVRSQSPFASYNFNQGFIDLEIGFCDYCIAGFVPPLQVSMSEFDAMDVDERMYAAWIDMQIHQHDESLRLRFNSIRQEYEQACFNLKGCLQLFAAG